MMKVCQTLRDRVCLFLVVGLIAGCQGQAATSSSGQGVTGTVQTSTGTAGGGQVSTGSSSGSTGTSGTGGVSSSGVTGTGAGSGTTGGSPAFIDGGYVFCTAGDDAGGSLFWM